MLWYYQRALDGRLSSPGGGASFVLTVGNQLTFPLLLWTLDAEGQPAAWGGGPVVGAASGMASSGDWFLATSALTGAFVCAFQVNEDNQSCFVTPSMLCDPNDIGHPPRSYGGGTIIPPDSPRVVVGAGWGVDGPIVREQYWERMSDSYCLAPDEVQVFSTTTTEGSQSTASSQTDVSSSLNLSASAGWGPVSASVSAALSSQSSTFQQVTVTQETTAYASDTLTNTTDNTQMYLRWQLTDVITLFTVTGTGIVPTASIITGANPVLTGKPEPVEQANQR